MKVREATYKSCKSCHTRLKMVRDEAYGCDECRKEIDMDKRGTDYLEARIFSKNHETIGMQFCSWRCCLRGLKKVKSDYFVSLPYLHYDEGILAKEFFKLMKA
jgi:hypothetical protein